MNENYNTNRNDALDWDSVIEAENEFVLLPEGEYEFTVKSFERGEYNVLCNSMLLTEGWDCPVSLN